jgi:PAS domain S-box-containing protein
MRSGSTESFEDDDLGLVSRSHEWHLAPLLETLPAAAYTCDPNGLITFFNEPALALWGRAPLLNDPIDRFCGSFKLFSKDGAPIAHDQCWMALALRRNEQYNGHEIIIERPDGERRTALAYANPLRSPAGDLVGAVNILVDITDRDRVEVALQLADQSKIEALASLAEELQTRQSMAEVLRTREERLAALVHQAFVGIAQMDLDGRLVFANNRYCDIVGRQPSQIIGLNCIYDLTHPEDVTESVRHFEDLRVHHLPFTAEKRYLRLDGSPVWVHKSVSLVRDADGKPLHAVAIVQDITDRKEADRRIHELNSDLQAQTTKLLAANKDLESFAYALSHDLRGPLLAIRGFAELLENEPIAFDHDGRRYLESIAKNATHMYELLDSLLAFSRLGGHQLQLETIDMEAMARTVLEEVLSGESLRSIEITIRRLPAATGCAPLVRQVFRNLLENAIKFTQMRSQTRIELGAFTEGETIEYFVRDNGVGFAMENSEALFGLFQRLHDPKQFEGSGLGLALVKRIVERHGGTVRAIGQIGEGATFYFTLPNPTART